MNTEESEKKSKIFDSCPHCGHKLSSWEQVLLNVDRALMCKNCWYRIILDLRDQQRQKPPKDQNKG